MSLKERTFTSEKGAVFVQVGISIFVMMAFNVFVLDYGMMWVGRRQAQNAADAGALAAGTALAYDDFTSPPSSSGIAAQSAQQVVAQNLVWQQAATPEVLFTCPAGVTGNCVQVNVYRNGQNGSTALPTLFGPIFGINEQGVRATATAIVANGNATDCLKPIALADNWNEANPAQNPSIFQHYSEPGGVPLTSPIPDTYVPPSATQAGNTQYSVDLGEPRIWDATSPPLTGPITDGLILELDLGGGAANFFNNFAGCPGQVVELGQTLPVFATRNSTTMAQVGFTALMARDPGVRWNEGSSRIDNSCAPSCASISPRLIAIALYDPDRYQLGRATGLWTDPRVGCPTIDPCITVTNIVGFFVHGPAIGRPQPHGHLLKYPGMTSSTAPTYVDDASWLVSTHLIR